MEWLNNFEKIGYWELNDNFKSHKVLSHLNLRGINFIVDKEKSKLENVVYVFKTKNEILYIGETTKGIKERFSSYRYGFDKLIDTDNRVKEEITKLLLENELIEIYLLQPKTIFNFNNEDIELSISKSLEDYLITTYKPRINKKENKSLKNKMHYQEKIDKIFGKGNLWKHRTLRTLFDPYSSEYNDTTLDRKLEILKTIKDNKIDLKELLDEYKEFYTEENKIHVVDVANEGLERLIKNLKD
jgi:hypothetical protein